MQVLPAGQHLLLPSGSVLYLFHLTFRTPITGSGNPGRVHSTDIAHTLEDSTMVSPQVQPGHQHGGGPIFPSFLHQSNFLALQNLKALCPHLISRKPEAQVTARAAPERCSLSRWRGPTSEDGPKAGPAQRLPWNWKLSNVLGIGYMKGEIMKLRRRRACLICPLALPSAPHFVMGSGEVTPPPDENLGPGPAAPSL